MDFKHNFKKVDIFNIFDPPPKMTNVILFFFLMKASLIRALLPSHSQQYHDAGAAPLC